jgi:hypothetical protein
VSRIVDDLEMQYPEHYPNEPIGGGNPYWRCTYCGKSDPQISIDRDKGNQGHYGNCAWAEMREHIATLKKKRSYWLEIDPETGNPKAEHGVCWAVYPADKPTAGTWIQVTEE